MSFDPDDFRAGQVLSARALNAFFTELERLGRVGIAAPLTLGDDAAGLNFGVALPEIWWVKLTSHGSGAKYAWTRQQAVTGGTWIAHPTGQTGTTTVDPAIETTGSATVATGTSVVYRAWRDPGSLALFFTAGAC